MKFTIGRGIFARVTCAVALLSTLVAASWGDDAGGKTQRPFWKVSSPTTEVYFLGSIHVATQDMYPLPPEIEAAYKQADVLVVEADITKVDQAAMAMQVMKDGTYAAGDTLDKHLQADTLKSLQLFCAANQVPFMLFNNLKPPLAAVMVEDLVIQKLGLSPELGVDLHFLNAANTDKKKILELESADSQLKLLLGMDEKLGDKWLAESLRDSSKDELDEIVKAWKAGDVKTIEAKTLDVKDADEEKIADELIYKRNDEMVKKIKEMLGGKEKVFVVVGAGHLIGEKGLLKQLEADHFKVERPELTTPAAK